MKTGQNTAGPTAALWNKSFTTLVLGGAASMLGHGITGFAVSLFGLQLSGMAALYALLRFLHTLPQLAAPLLAGVLADRFSRRRAVCLLDGAAAALCLGAAALAWRGQLGIGPMALLALLLGAAGSAWQVVFQSLYPQLVAPGRFASAYAVLGMLQTLAQLMVAVATVLYYAAGMGLLLVVSGALFLAAALLQARVADAQALPRPEAKPAAGLWAASCAGLRWLAGQKGLLCMALAAAAGAFGKGAAAALTLPWFQATQPQGALAYLAVWGFMLLGKTLSGMARYKWRLPAGARFAAAALCGTASLLLEGGYLFAPVNSMWIFCFLIGICDGFVYDLRAAAIQSYLPAGMQGRFNGALLTLCTAGTLLGQAAAGLAATAAPVRAVLCGCMLAAAAAAAALLAAGRRHVRPIYARES